MVQFIRDSKVIHARKGLFIVLIKATTRSCHVDPFCFVDQVTPTTRHFTTACTKA